MDGEETTVLGGQVKYSENSWKPDIDQSCTASLALWPQRFQPSWSWLENRTHREPLARNEMRPRAIETVPYAKRASRQGSR